jgi:nucleoside-triphosphatase THEP1
MSIFIFSGPVHSGKTTELLQWCGQIPITKTVAGILMPDINGTRKIYDIKTKEIFDIECTDPEQATASLTSVGKYHFYTAAFEKANAIIAEAASAKSDTLVIDEVGKLELEGKGLYESIKSSIENEVYKTGNKMLVLLIRDYLYGQAISFFNIKQHVLVHRLDAIHVQ